jgi:hypothetical protein
MGCSAASAQVYAEAALISISGPGGKSVPDLTFLIYQNEG